MSFSVVPLGISLEDGSPRVGSFFSLSMSKGGSVLTLMPELVTSAKVVLLSGLDITVHGIGPLKSSLGMRVRNQAASPGGRNRYPSTLFFVLSIIPLLFPD